MIAISPTQDTSSNEPPPVRLGRSPESNKGESDLPRPGQGREGAAIFLLHEWGERVCRQLSRALRTRFQLRANEIKVLLAVHRSPGISAKHIAEQTSLDKVVVSRAVRTLTTAGHVRRTPSEADYRCTELWLSEAGARAQAEIALILPQLLTDRLSGLDQCEHEVLCKILKNLGRLL